MVTQDYMEERDLLYVLSTELACYSSPCSLYNCRELKDQSGHVDLEEKLEPW